MTYQNLTTDKTRSPSSLMTMLYGLLAKMYNLQQNFCVRNGDKTQSCKTKVIIFSRSPLARNSERVLELYGERLKICPQVKFLGITFDSKFTSKNTLRKSWGAATPGITESDKNGDPARPPYYNITNNVSGQSSIWLPFDYNNIGRDHQ